MDGLKVFSKIKFSELNFGGTHNVKSLNELEDRLLRTSINSLERAKRRSLSRLDSEVKGLHHTLREQSTIRPVSSHLAKKVYDSSEFSAVKQATPTPAPSKRNEGQRCCVNGNEDHLIESEDSSEDEDEDDEIVEDTYDHIRHKGKPQVIRLKITPASRKDVFTTRPPPQRKLRRQRSTPDIHTSVVAVPSQPRRKISSVDSVMAKRDILFASPRLLHRPLACNSMEPATPPCRSPSNLSTSSQSIRQRKISAGSHSACLRRERRESTGSMVDAGQHGADSSPGIPRRKHPQMQQYTSVSQKQISRKISCPQPITGMKQEESYDLHTHRKDLDEGTRPRSTSELPRLDKPSSGLSFRNLSVSPIGRHIDCLDHTLQVRVNNFLMSLESFKDSTSEVNNEDNSFTAAKF